MVAWYAYGEPQLKHYNKKNMSYQALPYTYGALTNAQINALTGMSAGDTVFNTTSQMLEIYSGQLWVDERSVQFKIKEGVTCQYGNTMMTTTNGEVELADDTYPGRFCGIVVKGPTDGFVSVAHAGRVEAIAGSSIVSGRFAETYGAAGKINDSTAGTCLLYTSDAADE